VEFHLADRFFDEAIRLGGEHAAIDVEPASRPFKHAAARTAVDHLDAVRAKETHAGGGLWIVRRDGLHRAGFVQAERPLGEVEVVRANVGERAAGDPAPFRWSAFDECCAVRRKLRASTPSAGF
jgi:hypothetical protein